MRSGFLFNTVQQLFSRSYGVVTGDEPFPLRTRLRQELNHHRPKAILDVGCGSGSFALGEHDYTGIDSNAAYIAFCKKHRAGKFLQMRSDKLEFGNGTFEAVICFSVGHHLPDETLARTLEEIKRVLADDGIFYFSDVVRPIAGWKWAAQLLEFCDEGEFFRKEEDYAEFLRGGFTIEKRQFFLDQFYRTLLLSCKKSRGHGHGNG